MASENIINVSESDFEYQVLAYSEQAPVIVDFWAEWCVPCKTLGPLLERLTVEAQGSFRLAKVDVDQNPYLAMQYTVRSIPAVKAFRKGKVVAEFVGLQPEPKLRQFIRAITPSPADLDIEKGNSLLQQNKWSEAELAFEHALEINPDNSAGLLGLAKSLIAQGYAIEALDILRDFPPCREYKFAEALLPLASALERVQNGEYFSDEPLEAAFNRSLRLIQKANFPAAMDGLLDILREDKRFKNGEARLVLVALFELLGENALTRQYRQELASILF
jgi:putative thioredoxin